MSTSLHRRRTTAGVLAIGALVLTGCGLKPGATAQIAGARQNTVGTTTGGTAPTTTTDGTATAPTDGSAPVTDGTTTTTVDPATGATVTSGAPAVDPATGAVTNPGIAGGAPVPGVVSGGGSGSTGSTGSTGTTGTTSGAKPGTTTAAKPGTTTTTTTTTTKKPTTTTSTKPGSTGTTGSTGGTGTATGPGAAPVAGGSRIGIDDAAKVIHITLHTPITGAAPVPQAAFTDDSVNLFWKDPAHNVFGYKVVADVKDDTYNPTQARVVCEDASRRSFIVIGGAGTDQIQACATDPVLAQSRTPYLSGGVTTNGLSGLSNYFAYSATYRDQSPAVANLAKLQNADLSRCAIVATETSNFDDAAQSAEAAFRAAGCKDLKVFRTDKSGSLQAGSQAGATVGSYNPTTAYVDMAPTFWIGMLSGYTGIPANPQWVGPGVTMGINTVARTACGASKAALNAAFLSPSPGLEREPAAFAATPGVSSDPTIRDLQMQIYGASEIFYRAFTSVGSLAALTRENFINALPRFRTSGLSVFPTVDFPAGGGHFGGQGAWGLKADCAAQKYVTVGSAPFPL